MKTIIKKEDINKDIEIEFEGNTVYSETVVNTPFIWFNNGELKIKITNKVVVDKDMLDSLKLKKEYTDKFRITNNSFSSNYKTWELGTNPTPKSDKPGFKNIKEVVDKSTLIIFLDNQIRGLERKIKDIDSDYEYSDSIQEHIDNKILLERSKASKKAFEELRSFIINY